MKVKKYLEKFKSQKGATGADIIIAVTIIVLTMAVVSMIYANTTIGSRNVNRTAGATRIATNILENIEKLSYNDFVSNFNTQVVEGREKETVAEFLNYYKIQGSNGAKIFSTKIPKGYTVYIKSEANYGTHTSTEEQFDLVRNVDVIVCFNNGDNVETIEFNSVKTREIIDESNKPNIEYLSTSGITSSEIKYYPIMYLETAGAYVKIDENDASWYDYSNKEWATIVVSRLSADEIFDVNGKFIGTINTTKTDAAYTEKFIWIPRFFTKTVDGNTEFYSFAYLGSGIDKIVSITLESAGADDEATLTLNTFDTITDEEKNEGVNTDTSNFGGQTGKWVSAENTAITTDEDANLLNESKYGPYISK